VRARNVQKVADFYEADRRRDIEAWGALWHREGRHTFWLADPTPPVVGRDELVSVSQRKFDVRPPYGIEVTADALADPTMVLARLRLTFETSPAPPVDLWCLFHFDTEGLITEIEEIVDTARPQVFPQ
jgi:hypothetical protein